MYNATILHDDITIYCNNIVTICRNDISKHYTDIDNSWVFFYPRSDQRSRATHPFSSRAKQLLTGTLVYNMNKRNHDQ